MHEQTVGNRVKQIAGYMTFEAAATCNELFMAAYESHGNFLAVCFANFKIRTDGELTYGECTL
jgi:hypothetical protein